MKKKYPELEKFKIWYGKKQKKEKHEKLLAQEEFRRKHDNRGYADMKADPDNGLYGTER